MKTPRLSVEQISAIMEIAQDTPNCLRCDRAFICYDTLVVKFVKAVGGHDEGEYRVWNKQTARFEHVDSIHFEAPKRKIVDSGLVGCHARLC